MAKIQALVLAAILVVAVVAGSFYVARAQQQGAPEIAKITLSSDKVQTGSSVDVSGKNFNPNSQVSTYLMSAMQANLTNHNALILQQVSSGNNTLSNTTSTSTAASGGSSNDFFGNIMNNLRSMFNFGTNKEDNTTTSALNSNNSNSSDSGYVLVILDSKVANGNVRLECDNNSIAEGTINNTTFVNLKAQSGTYQDCSLSISGINDSSTPQISKFGKMTIAASPDRNYENSKISSARTDAQGTFTTTVSMPATIEPGKYAILGVGGDVNDNNSLAAAATFSVVSQTAVTSQNTTNSSSTSNNTITSSIQPSIPGLNSTSTAATNQTENTNNSTAVENSTSNSNGTTAQAKVQVDESNAQPGSPLTVTGQGFAPNKTVQVFINNIQITNVITNIQGSFNTVVIVPTTVNSGTANVVVKTGQTNISKHITVILPSPEEQNAGPSTLRFTAVSAADKAQSLKGAPVTVFDASSGRLVGSGKTPADIELDAGTYSVFYSNFKSFKFSSAQPGTWTSTPNGGSGLVTVREGKNTTITALYSQVQPSAPKPAVTDNSLTLRSVDTNGNPVNGMFVTVYNASTGEKIEQGFTEDKIEHLSPGTYPIFFANFGQLAFASATPGDWVQTPFGGAGLVTIPDDGSNHDIVVTAEYVKTVTPEQPAFRIKAPLDISGQIFTITSNETHPRGPFVISGTFAVKVDSEQNPLKANLTAYFMSVKDDANPNVQLDSQGSRHHETFQIVDFKPKTAGPVGLNSYLLSGTADLLHNGNMYSSNENVSILISGGKTLTPTNVEIDFQGHGNHSASKRLDTLYGAVTSGFK